MKQDQESWMLIFLLLQMFQFVSVDCWENYGGVEGFLLYALKKIKRKKLHTPYALSSNTAKLNFTIIHSTWGDVIDTVL